MIIFFGPAGAGKSVQGQILSARHGWRHLSAGQLLRDTHDHELIKEMQTGALVDESRVNQIMGQALENSKDLDHVILDGYPRQLTQAKWLIDHEPEHERSIKIVVVLEVPKSEILRRLKVRGRVDDTEAAIEERLRIYRQEIYPILSYFTDEKIYVVHIDGTGTVGQVHDRIEAELEAQGLAAK
ncbi:MAG TPA: nucleoside monophosphate kinase [Candidatus Saccharimonadales bacterium]|nr:nucleoside monophosphate kinase [Candidatus Saccharimonadales bacterium]